MTSGAKTGGRQRDLFLLLFLCVFAPWRNAAAAPPEPPPVVLRDIAAAPRSARGTSVSLERTTVTIALSGQAPRESTAEVVLFLPEGWTDTLTTSAVPLTVHFHGAPWFAIEEHARRGARHPLLAVHLGEGSSMYQRPLENRDYFPALLEKARARAAENAGVSGLRFGPLEVQSFSAGYGAVRELLKDVRWQREIRRLVLADSLYASLTTDSAGLLQPDSEQMRPFVRYAEQARQNGSAYQFLIAHSTIRVGSYADTVHTSDYLIERLGGTRSEVTTGSLPAAAADAPFPLESRYDENGVHIWAYHGATPQAHMAIARTIPEFWHSLSK